MFNFLKDKLKSWFKKSGEKAEEKAEETGKEKIEEAVEKEKKEIKKEVKIPSKFELGKLNVEPDLGALKEKVEEIKKEEKGFLARIKDKFKFKLDEEYFEEIFSELELILLENNVALSVVEKIKADLKKELLNLEIKKDEVKEKIEEALRISLESIIEEPFDLIEEIKSKEGLFIIVFFGINGSGKTTTIAKIADLLLKNNLSCILAASDTFRAASIEQLEKHAEKLGVKLIKSKYGADPASVAFDAINHAKSHKIKVVLIDTAGRMHTKENLLKEMEKIVRISKPDLKIFVAESITGNDATQQAKNFNESIGIDAIILTKADVDEKGGTAISVSYITGKPILFLGTGQEYKNLEKFDKEKLLKQLGFE